MGPIICKKRPGERYVCKVAINIVDECPVDLRKLQLAVGFDVLERYKALVAVCTSFGGRFKDDAAWYQKRILAIEKKLSSK